MGARARSWGCAFLFLGMAFSGCTCTSHIEVDAPLGSLLVAAVVDDEGRVEAVGVTRAGATAAGVPYERGRRVFVFVVPADAVVDARGAAASEAMMAEVVAVRRDDPTVNGSCGRCSVPAVDGTPVVLPGDLCPIPASAEAVIFETGGAPISPDGSLNAEIVRAQVQLQWPGPCECTPSTIRPAPPLTLCPLLPQAAPIRASRIALSDEGSVLGVNNGFAFTIDPSGTVRNAPLVPIPLTVRAVAPVPGEEAFLMSVQAQDTEEGGALFRLDRELNGDLLEVDRRTRPRRMRALEPDGSIYLLGDQDLGAMEILDIQRCERTDFGYRCASEQLDYSDCPRAEIGVVTDAIVLPSGDAVASTDQGHLLYRARGTHRFRCDPGSHDTPFSADGNTTLLEMFDLANLGQRLFACVRVLGAQPNESQFRILTATVGAVLQSGLPDPPPSYRLVEGYIPSYCSGFHPIAGGTQLRSISFGGGDGADLDADGRLVATYVGVGSEPGLAAELLPELPERIDRVTQNATGWTLAQSIRGHLYRAPPGGAFQAVYAPTLITARALRHPVPYGPGRIATFTLNGAPELIERGDESRCEDVKISTVEVEGWPPVAGVLDMVVPDSRNPNHFLAIVRGPDTRALVIDLEARRVVSNRALDPQVIPEIHSGGELRSGVFIFALYDGRMFELTDERWEPIAPTYDDPNTDTPEVAPTPLPLRPPWEAFSAAQGIGWFAGQDAIARILPGVSGAPSRVEGYWLRRVVETSRDSYKWSQPPHATAVRATCANQILVNTREIREFDIGAKSDSPSPLLVQPGKDTCGKTISDASELALCRDSIFDPKEVPPGAVQAIATFLESAQSTSVYQDGSILRAGAARIVTPFPTPVRAARSSGIIAISDGGGHVVVALE